jgi:assimilatory nitrate reductase catalytic subunit
MLIGVKERPRRDRAGQSRIIRSVAAALPEGLSEHHTIDTSNRAKYPLLAPERPARSVSWSEAIDTMAGRFRDVQRQYGRQAVGVISTGQLVTEEFYTLGKLVQLGIGTRTTTATPRCACPPRCRLQDVFGSDGPPGAYEDLDTPTSCC